MLLLAACHHGKPETDVCVHTDDSTGAYLEKLRDSDGLPYAMPKRASLTTWAVFLLTVLPLIFLFCIGASANRHFRAWFVTNG